MAPGPTEIAYGTKKINRLAAETDLPVVSANLEGFQTYAILNKNSEHTRVLVTSVIDPALLSKEQGAAKDPVPALQRIHRQVPHDLFVVVIHAGAEAVSSIIDQCPDIDLVIDGTASEFRPEQPAGNRPPVVANNTQGMYLAYIDYAFNGRNRTKFSEPVQIKADVEKVAQDPIIRALIEEYDCQRQDFLKRQSKTRPASSNDREARTSYIGSQSCQVCHPEINDNWRDSRHAEAMDSLFSMSRQNDPDCLTCHVTGTAQKSATDVRWSRKGHTMGGVQCEACHGPGADHSRNPICFGMLAVDENTCIQCHTRFQDPSFDYHDDLYKIDHGGMNLELKSNAEQRQQECGSRQKEPPLI